MHYSMENHKHISVQTSDNVTLTIEIKEHFSPDLSVFLWPASYVLSCYLASQRDQFEDKTLLEIGAGIGLPSLVGGKLCSAKQIYISDRANEPTTFDLITTNIALNNLQDICKAVRNIYVT